MNGATSRLGYSLLAAIIMAITLSLILAARMFGAPMPLKPLVQVKCSHPVYALAVADDQIIAAGGGGWLTRWKLNHDTIPQLQSESTTRFAKGDIDSLATREYQSRRVTIATSWDRFCYFESSEVSNPNRSVVKRLVFAENWDDSPPVVGCVISPDGQHAIVASGTPKNTLALVSISSFQVIQHTPDVDWGDLMEISLEGTTLATIYTDNVFAIWEVGDRLKLKTSLQNTDRGQFTSCTLLNQGSQLAIGRSNGAVTLISTRNGEVLKNRQVDGWVHAIYQSDNYVYISYDNPGLGSVEIWDSELKSRLQRYFFKCPGSIRSIAHIRGSNDIYFGAASGDLFICREVQSR